MATNENFSDANRARVAYVKEVVYGETPSTPTMQKLRVLSSELTVTKDTSQSDEIRDDRQISDLAAVAYSSGGSIPVEMSMLNFDDLLEAVIGNDFVNGGNVSGNTSWSKTGNNVTVTAVTGLTVAANDIVFFSAGGIDNFYVVVSYDGNSLVFSDTADLLTTGSGDYVVSASQAKNGVQKYSFSIEQGYQDNDKFQLFKGQRAGTFTLEIDSGARVTGSFEFMGLDVAYQTGEFGTGYLEPAPTSGLNTSTNVADVIIDGETLEVCIQSINLTIDNTMREQRGIGNQFPCNIAYGRQIITGSMTAYFIDFDLYQLFYEHGEISLSIPLVDKEGNSLGFYMPKVKLNTNPISVTGVDSDILQEIEFQAIYSPEAGYTLNISRHDISMVAVAATTQALSTDNEE